MRDPTECVVRTVVLEVEQGKVEVERSLVPRVGAPLQALERFEQRVRRVIVLEIQARQHDVSPSDIVRDPNPFRTAWVLGPEFVFDGSKQCEGLATASQLGERVRLHFDHVGDTIGEPFRRAACLFESCQRRAKVSHPPRQHRVVVAPSGRCQLVLVREGMKPVQGSPRADRVEFHFDPVVRFTREHDDLMQDCTHRFSLFQCGTAVLEPFVAQWILRPQVLEGAQPRPPFVRVRERHQRAL